MTDTMTAPEPPGSETGMADTLTAELFAELRPSLEVAMRVIARKNGEEIEDGFSIPQIILDVADSCTLLLTYIDALEAENANLKAQVAAAEYGLSQAIGVMDDIVAGNDSVFGDMPTYNQIRRIIGWQSLMFRRGMDPDNYRATSGGTS